MNKIIKYTISTLIIIIVITGISILFLNLINQNKEIYNKSIYLEINELVDKRVIYSIDYSAMNGFGGYNRSYYMFLFSNNINFNPDPSSYNLIDNFEVDTSIYNINDFISENVKIIDGNLINY